jgi:hypothetical protein
MSFQIKGLPKEPFENLFALSLEELTPRRARKVIADTRPGFPCRVSLQDAEIGEETILVNYVHQDAESPFHSSHAIYVRANAIPADLAVNEVPDMFRLRIFSLRAFDASGMMTMADLADGKDLETALGRLFESVSTGYVHLHFAKPGCYAARADRA